MEFDEDTIRASLRAGAISNPTGNGYIAQVRRIEDDTVLYDSHESYLGTGLFKERRPAEDHADRWLDAWVAKVRTEHDLKIERGLVLAEKLGELATKTYDEEQKRKAAATAIKSLKEEHDSLIAECNHPEVEIHFTPTSEGWRIYVAPSVSDGTAKTASKQLAFAEFGVEQVPEVDREIVATVQTMIPEGDDTPRHPTDPVPTEDTTGKAPASTREAGGHVVRVGSFVKLATGDWADVLLEVVEIGGTTSDGARVLGVTRHDTGEVGRVMAQHCARQPKPTPKSKAAQRAESAANASETTGLDPSNVVWPEDVIDETETCASCGFADKPVGEWPCPECGAAEDQE